ncbi:MAG: response regulator transcription factor [Cyclobacteriaceae bacterium]
MTVKKVLLVDDHSMIRDALKHYLKDEPNYSVSFEAENGKQALEILSQNEVDVIIADINMPVMNGMELMENVTLSFPAIPVLVISMLDDERAMQKMIALGAKGYVMKNTRQQELVKALDNLTAGKQYFSLEVSQKIRALIERRKKLSLYPEDQKLSSVEIEVLRMMIQYANENEITRVLNQTPKTLDLIQKSIYRKTSCTGIPGLTVYAAEHGLL